jgi:hypothetical protein
VLFFSGMPLRDFKHPPASLKRHKKRGAPVVSRLELKAPEIGLGWNLKGDSRSRPMPAMDIADQMPSVFWTSPTTATDRDKAGLELAAEYQALL